MSSMKSPRTARVAKLVLLVGGDQETARSCARAACLPVIRARRVGVAADHLRSMHPVAMVLAADVTEEDAAQLERIADGRARVLHMEPGATAHDLDADLADVGATSRATSRRAVGHR